MVTSTDLSAGSSGSHLSFTHTDTESSLTSIKAEGRKQAIGQCVYFASTEAKEHVHTYLLMHGISLDGSQRLTPLVSSRTGILKI